MIHFALILKKNQHSMYVNISGYQFTALTNLETLQKELTAYCQSLKLKGTILLAQEGINLFLAGKRTAIDCFYHYLSSFTSIDFKESLSIALPFKKMHVKIKSEIIAFGVPSIQPQKKAAPLLSVHTFKQWLDENKPLVILDTRNQYEVRLGKFKNAIQLNIDHFREFPQSTQKLTSDFKNQTIVTYCTGGIRCEKAALYLLDQGFQKVYQLQGGILKYLEHYQDSHFEGECFVFDKRTAVNCALEPSPTLQCLACRQPVTAFEQASSYYVSGQSCPALIVIARLVQKTR